MIDSWRAIRLGESMPVHKEWIETRRKDYGDNVIVMLEKGMEITAVDYINAHKMRKEIRTAFLDAMKEVRCTLGANYNYSCSYVRPVHSKYQ